MVGLRHTPAHSTAEGDVDDDDYFRLPSPVEDRFHLRKKTSCSLGGDGCGACVCVCFFSLHSRRRCSLGEGETVPTPQPSIMVNEIV